jgi:hypothetical protein
VKEGVPVFVTEEVFDGVLVPVEDADIMGEPLAVTEAV